MATVTKASIVVSGGGIASGSASGVGNTAQAQFVVPADSYAIVSGIESTEPANGAVLDITNGFNMTKTITGGSFVDFSQNITVPAGSTVTLASVVSGAPIVVRILYTVFSNS